MAHSLDMACGATGAGGFCLCLHPFPCWGWTARSCARARQLSAVPALLLLLSTLPVLAWCGPGGFASKRGGGVPWHCARSCICATAASPNPHALAASGGASSRPWGAGSRPRHLCLLLTQCQGHPHYTGPDLGHSSHLWGSFTPSLLRFGACRTGGGGWGSLALRSSEEVP